MKEEIMARAKYQVLVIPYFIENNIVKYCIFNRSDMDIWQFIACAKAITHEYRHVFQIFYANMFNDERAKRWRSELSTLVNTSNMDNEGMNYINQELELDAFAFTKYYLMNYESIIVKNKIVGYDEVINKYISFNYKFLQKFMVYPIGINMANIAQDRIEFLYKYVKCMLMVRLIKMKFQLRKI